jgi:HK97 family phage major capsid protein
MTKEELEQKEQEDKQKAIAEIAEAVTPAVVEKMKADKPLRKEIFGDGNTSEKAELKEKQDNAAEFLKAVIGRDSARKKALSSGTSSAGTELVPTYVSDQLIGIAQNYGLMRKHANKWPMKGINENIPTITSVQAYRLSTDTSAITATQPSTGNIQLRAKTVGAIIPVSKVLLQNATVDVVDAIVALAAKAIAKLEDQWGLLGLAANEGVFQTTGVPVATLASGETTYNKVVATDLLDVEDLVDENFISDRMRWAMSRSVLNNLRRERSVVGSDPQGFLLPGYGVNTPPTLWDYPYDTTSVMPKNSDGSQAGTKFLALVDYENVIFGDAREYQIELSDQATITDVDGSTLINLFQQEMVALKVTEMIDIKLSNPTKAFGVLKTAAS